MVSLFGSVCVVSLVVCLFVKLEPKLQHVLLLVMFDLCYVC